MENNIDDILKDKAFDCMDDKNKQELKELCIKMQGKDRKSTRLNPSHVKRSRMPSSA